MDDSRSTSLHDDGKHEGEETEEYVLIDLDGVSSQVCIPPNAPYVLSGLDTLNPILIIDDKIKLIGEYEETIGTCLVFSETDGTVIAHEETGPSEANLFSERCIIDSNRSLAKDIMPMASLHKILKFRLMTDADTGFLHATNNQANSMDDQLV